MNQYELMENPFSLDPSLKSLLTYKAQEKNVTPVKEEQYQKPYDRLYYNSTNSHHYGLIKKLEEQALGLSDLRGDFLSSEKKGKATPTHQKGFTVSAKSKTELPAIKSGHKPKRNTLALPEKKETLREFLDKGKQIFLEKMMTNMKREENLRLTEFIINEDETLNEHEADFREHVKFSNQFIQELNKDAENTFVMSKNKAKEIAQERSKIAQLEQQIKTIESQIKKKEEDKEVYESYKKFCEELYQSAAIKYLSASPEPAKKKVDPSKFFLTQNNGGEEGAENKEGQEGEDGETKTQTTSIGNPLQIVELLKLLDDATIFLIHNTQEKEEDLQKARKAFAAQKKQIDEKFTNRKESLNNVQKLYEKLKKEKDQAHEKLNKLRLLEKAPHKVDEEESGSVNKAKVFHKIHEMTENLIDERNAKESIQQDATSDNAIRMMELLERELEELIKFYNVTKTSEANIKILNDIEREITKERRMEKAQLKQELDRQKNLQALEKQKNKKTVVRKGRKAMNKILLEKEDKVEEIVDEDLNKNDDEKYFKDTFAFMDTVKAKPNKTEDGRTATATS